MPANKKLGPLYAAKAKMRRAMTSQSNDPESPEVRLWVAVIEQAVFDAHIYRSRGETAAAIDISTARRFFQTVGFTILCEQIGVEPCWVRSMTGDIEAKAREIRGDEYEGSLQHGRSSRASQPQPRPHHDIRKRQQRLF